MNAKQRTPADEGIAAAKAEDAMRQMIAVRTGLILELEQDIARLKSINAELVAALELAAALITIARPHFPKSMHNGDKFTLENTCASIGRALHKATKGE